MPPIFVVSLLQTIPQTGKYARHAFSFWESKSLSDIRRIHDFDIHTNSCSRPNQLMHLRTRDEDGSAGSVQIETT